MYQGTGTPEQVNVRDFPDPDLAFKRGYLKQCRKYCPTLELDDLLPREAGIRAQAVMKDGSFVHDFLLRQTPRTLHVINAPSPAATSALPIGRLLARDALGLTTAH